MVTLKLRIASFAFSLRFTNNFTHINWNYCQLLNLFYPNAFVKYGWKRCQLTAAVSSIFYIIIDFLPWFYQYIVYIERNILYYLCLYFFPKKLATVNLKTLFLLVLSELHLPPLSSAVTPLKEKCWLVNITPPLPSAAESTYFLFNVKCCLVKYSRNIDCLTTD